MSSFKMIVSVVPHDKGEKLTEAAVKAGCGGGTVLMGRGLAKSNIASILGTGETTKDIICMIVPSEQRFQIIDAIVRASENEKSNFGSLFSLDVSDLVKAGTVSGGECTMNTENGRDMIAVIVNKGFADDVMFAARKAGATGGTVITARGTAREDDEKFFGMHIVPEKDMLVIVVDHEKKSAVLSAVSELSCLKEPGMGIAFSAGVGDFTLLGKKRC